MRIRVPKTINDSLKVKRPDVFSTCSIHLYVPFIYLTCFPFDFVLRLKMSDPLSCFSFTYIVFVREISNLLTVFGSLRTIHLVSWPISHLDNLLTDSWFISVGIFNQFNRIQRKDKPERLHHRDEMHLDRIDLRRLYTYISNPATLSDEQRSGLLPPPPPPHHLFFLYE